MPTIENQPNNDTQSSQPFTSPVSSTNAFDTSAKQNAKKIQQQLNNKISHLSPTVKGVMIGAVAGSVLPVFGTVSGAIIGGIAGKIYQRKCRTAHH